MHCNVHYRFRIYCKCFADVSNVYMCESVHKVERHMQERAMGVPRPHIPYRNSLMTMVLRDSLGGNCKTTMVANVNLSPDFLDESISTCRFAQRVAMVSNVVSVNEEADPALVIARLRAQVRDLQGELQLLRVRCPTQCAPYGVRRTVCLVYTASFLATL